MYIVQINYPTCLTMSENSMTTGYVHGLLDLQEPQNNKNIWVWIKLLVKSMLKLYAYVASKGRLSWKTW